MVEAVLFLYASGRTTNILREYCGASERSLWTATRRDAGRGRSCLAPCARRDALHLNQVETAHSTHILEKELSPKTSHKSSARIQKGYHQIGNKNPAIDNKKPAAKLVQVGSPQGLCEETREVHCTAAQPFRFIVCLSR